MRKKTLIILIILLFILALSAGLLLWYFKPTHKNHAHKAPATRVVVSPVSAKILPDWVQTTGTLSAWQQANISSKIAGYVKNIRYIPGQYVQAGQILLTLDNSQQQDALAAAKASANLKANTYHRINRLYQKGLASPEALDKVRAQYAQSQAEVLSAQNALANTELKAPFNGFIGAKLVSIGDYITPGQILTTLTNSKKLRVKYSLPSQYLASLRLGQKVIIQSKLTPIGSYHAKVSYIADQINPTTQTINLYAITSNEHNQLKPGEFVYVSQLLGHSKKILLIPIQCVLVNLSGTYVYVIEHQRAIRTQVVVGKRLDRVVIIKKGLKVGQQVVSAGQNQLHNRARVKIIHEPKS